MSAHPAGAPPPPTGSPSAGSGDERGQVRSRSRSPPARGDARRLSGASAASSSSSSASTAVTPRMLELLREVHEWPVKYQAAEGLIGQLRGSVESKDATIYALTAQLVALQAQAADTRAQLLLAAAAAAAAPQAAAAAAAPAAGSVIDDAWGDRLLQALEQRVAGSLSALVARLAAGGGSDEAGCAGGDSGGPTTGGSHDAQPSTAAPECEGAESAVDEAGDAPPESNAPHEAQPQFEGAPDDEAQPDGAVSVPRAQLQALLGDYEAAAADGQVKAGLIDTLKASLCEVMAQYGAAMASVARVAALEERASQAESEAAYHATVARCLSSTAASAAGGDLHARRAPAPAPAPAPAATAAAGMSPLKRPSAGAAGSAPASRRSASTLDGSDDDDDDAPLRVAGASSSDDEEGGGGMVGADAEEVLDGGGDDGGGGGGSRGDAGSCGSVEPWVEQVVHPLRQARKPDFMLQAPPWRGGGGGGSGGGRKRAAPAGADGATGAGGAQRASKRARAGSSPGGTGAAAAGSARHEGTCTSQDHEALSNDVELLQRSVGAAHAELERAAFVNDALLGTLDALRAKFNGRLVALEAAHRDELATLRTEHAIAVALHLAAAAAAAPPRGS